MKKLLSLTQKFYLVAFVMLMAAPAFGQVLFSNAIDGVIHPAFPALVNPYTSGQIVDPNITVSGIGIGSGVAGTNVSNTYQATGWNSVTKDTDDYFEWTITPDSGRKIDFTSLVVNLSRSAGVVQLQWSSNVSGTQSDIGGPIAFNSNTSNVTLDLSSPTFQNRTTAITVRLYAYGATGPLVTLGVNSFVFNGSTPGIFYNPITGTAPGNNNPYAIGQQLDPSISSTGIGTGNTGAFTTDNRYNRGNFLDTSLANAISNNRFISWTIVPVPGYQIDFTNLVVTLQSGNGNFPAGNVILRASSDNFNTFTELPSFDVTTTATTFERNLQVAGLTGISTPITFRLYGWVASGNLQMSVNDFNFGGSVTPIVGAPPLLGSNASSPLVFNNLTFGVESSPSQTVMVYGLNPGGGYGAGINVNVNAQPNILVSADNVTFSSTATLTLTSSAQVPLYIKMNPSFFGTQTFANGITLTAAPFTDHIISVQGNVVSAAPVATAATMVTADSFQANWNTYPNATSYNITVRTFNFSPTTQNFNTPFGFGTNNSEWTASGTVLLVADPAPNASNRRVRLVSNLSTIRSPMQNNPSQLSFILTQPSSNQKILKIFISSSSAGFGSSFIEITQNQLAIGEPTLFTIDLSSFANSSGQYIWFQKSDSGNGNPADSWLIDDVTITRRVKDVVTAPNYNNISAGSGNSFEVNGLQDNKQYFYTIAAVKGGQTVDSNEIPVTTGTVTVIWNGTAWTPTAPNEFRNAIIDGAYNTTTNGSFTAQNLTVNANKPLIIGSSGNVVLNGNFTNSGNASNVIVQSDGNLVQRTPNPAASGAITVRRNTQPLMRLDYVAWGSPVKNQNLADFSPFTWGSRFYTYDTESVSYTNLNPYLEASPINQFQDGKGYLIRMPNNHPVVPTVWTGEFIGVPNTGLIPFTMFNGGDEANINLIGNPYPSAINLGRFINGNNNNITGELWFWRKTNGEDVTAYVSYVDGVWSGPAYDLDLPDDELNVGQGFLVKARPAATVVNFTNSMRSVVNGTSYRTSNEVLTEDEKHIMWLKLIKDGQDSSIAIAYSTGATNGFDEAKDGRAINDGEMEFTSIVPGATGLAIQQRALPFVTTDEVPLRFKTTIAGTYTISLSGMTGLFLGDQNIYLKDLLTNVTHDLKAQDYTFTSVAGTFDTRFKIVYENVTLGVGDNFIPENGVIAFVDSKVLNVTSVNQTIEKVVVFDISGRKVVEQQKVNDTSTQLSLSGIARQILLVQITTDLGVFTKKVVF
jgi:hypothetical protein